MSGIILYLITLLLETISVVVRFTLVSGLVALFAGGDAAMTVGALAAVGPPIYSLLILAGLPSGHLLVRRGLGARPLSSAERSALEQALAGPRAAGVAIPRRAFTIPAEGLNAAISGRTLYVYQELYSSPYLPAVLAHELGHFNSSDGRLLLAIRALTVPGGFMIVWALLQVLRWVAYLISTVLIALILVIFALSRVRFGGATGFIFGLTVSILRLAIIFAVGGVGPTLLGSLWRSYFTQREYVADAYAGRLGYANDLIAFFENEVLNDVSIPWQDEPTHPPASRRIAELRKLAATFPQHSPAAPGAPTLAEPRPAAPAQAGLAPAAGMLTTRPAPGRSPRLLASLLVVALVATLAAGIAFSALSRPTAPGNAFVPTPGPTPTLGLPARP